MEYKNSLGKMIDKWLDARVDLFNQKLLDDSNN